MKMRRFGNDKKFGDRSTMYKATCSKCGNSCEVPFRPNGSKPVFCRDCFRKENGGTSGSFKRLPDPRPAIRAHQDELAKVNEKLDKILKLLEPTEK